MGLLDGVRVLDLSRVLAGPYCASLLADLGAEVVKVESPTGDDARHLGPFMSGESVYFAQLNRNKRSIVLDLKQPEDHDLLLRLVARADVLVENFRPGVMTRLDLEHPRLREVNPRLVHASISGFGQTGPMAGHPAYDLVVQAMSGLMAATGTPDGEPTRVGESLGDLMAGLFAGWGVCAALFDRERTGRGRHVDVGMLDSLISLQVTALSVLTATGRLPGRVGNRHPVSAPFDTYRTADGLVAIAVANDAIFARFCHLVGRPDLVGHPDFADDPHRSAQVERLRQLTEDWCACLSTEEALAQAAVAGVPAAPIWDLEQALASDQVRHRGLTGRFDHPVLGEVPYLRAPVLFDTAAPVAARPSPTLDADREEVLHEWLGAPVGEVTARGSREVG